MAIPNTFNVSIIDDDSMMREMIIDYFQSHFPEAIITSFITGEDALEADLKNQNLIVLDYHLSATSKTSMNGLQVLMQLNDLYDALPVIVLSGQENPEVAANILKHGAWDYIIKNESTFSRLGIEVSKLIDRAIMINETASRSKMVRLSILVATLLFLGLLAERFI